MKASAPASFNGRWRLLACALFALVTGALSLRTRGVYFIMITLAFAQMIYYVGVSLDRYGADDGLTIYKRSDFAGLINLSNKTTFYYVCFVCLMLTCYLVYRLVNSRFGMVIQGARSRSAPHARDRLPTYRYQLTCFVIAGVLCGLSGILLGQPHRFRQSGDHALDTVGRSHCHGRAGRHGFGARSGDRCRGPAGAGRMAAACDFGGRASSSPVNPSAQRRNIGR